MSPRDHASGLSGRSASLSTNRRHLLHCLQVGNVISPALAVLQVVSAALPFAGHSIQMNDEREGASPSGSGHIVHPRERHGFLQDRSIHIAPTPKAAGDLPWPTSPPEYRMPVSKPVLRTSPKPAAQNRIDQGVMGRMASWFGASTSGRNGSAHSRAQHSSSSGVPDFLAQADDPDKRRIDHARAQNRAPSGSLEEQWRQECLAFARVRKLKHAADMRIFYVDPDARDRDGDPVVVAIGAHYRSQALTKEDLLLHVVNEMEKIGNQRFVVVYFNADTHMGLFPNNTFFLDAHSALRPSHRRQMKALYAVHPNPLLRAWIISLRLSEPDIYGRVDYCERLGNLNVYFSGGKAPVPPQHVLDYDAEH
ncbi:g2996 [Coccomyxa viridis]|uniref:G2996 protein n=1 Tax=Coccomyxa viridis TaxID=1274662 RepID=A0ABP1FTT2_9CHLO